MKTVHTSQKGLKMKIGLASENNLPDAYSPKSLDNNEQVTLQVGSEKLTIATNSFQAVANVLSMFAPDGTPTLEPGTTFYLRDGFSDRETSITANALMDVAQALATFAVKPGKFIPVLEEDETNSQTDKVKATATNKPVAPKPAKTVEVKQDEPATKQAPVITNVSSDAEERKKPGRKPSAKIAEVTTTVKDPSIKEPAETDVPKTAEHVAQILEPTVATEGPAKRRGRPPKNRAVTETNVKPAEATEKPKGRSKKANAETSATASTSAPKRAAVNPIRTPHPSGGPFPAAMTENHKDSQISVEVPDFMKDLKAFYIIGEGEDYRFDFTALEMDPAKRRTVVGPASSQSKGSTFGYEVKSKAGEHIGWIIIEAENKFVMAGIPEMEISSHRNIEGPITKTGIAIANKVASIRARAA
jgi:hypothetical protein